MKLLHIIYKSYRLSTKCRKQQGAKRWTYTLESLSQKEGTINLTLSAVQSASDLLFSWARSFVREPRRAGECLLSLSRIGLIYSPSIVLIAKSAYSTVMFQRETHYGNSRAFRACFCLEEVLRMFFAFRLMNDTIFVTFLTAVPVILHRTMMFRGSLFETRHGVDSGCRFRLLLPVGSRLLS